ncbi:MAG: hypothetical protein U0414_11830 [Polyangiaceae bacterium]
MSLRRLLRHAWLAVPAGVFLGALTAHGAACSLATTSGTGGYTTGTTSTNATSGTGMIKDASPDGTPPPHSSNYAELCGQGDCQPGVASACARMTTGAGGAPGTTTSTSSTSGSGGSSTSGAPLPDLGCQVSADGEHPSSVCAALGQSGLNGPCQSASDCAEGLGCVVSPDQMEPMLGLCRPYCCGDWEDCPAETYCAPRPQTERPDRLIPVCTGVVPCQLLTEGACADGLMCTVVRADGSTSCVPKGTGELCGSCPCAPGFVCSGEGVCQKLCHTDATDECGVGSLCQGGSVGYPDGIGLCVGGDSTCP